MKLLLTGGSGFIGTHLIEQLLGENHEITIFDKRPSASYPHLVVLGDVRDAEALEKVAAGKDAIYHLAAEHTDDVRPVSLYYDVNVGGTRNVTAAAESAGIDRIVFTSSVAVYPLGADMPDEGSPPGPFNDYGRSKLAAEETLTEWAGRDSSRSLVTIRPCAIFGNRNYGNIYNLLRQIYKGRFVMVGAGRNKKSIGYVGNLVRFLVRCLDSSPGSFLFNYADKPDLATAELVSIARRALGRGEGKLRIPYPLGLLAGYAFDVAARVSRRKFPVSAVRVRKLCASTTVSATRLLRTGFKPPHSLTEALERTIATEFLERFS